jgi:hypothetical protein
MRGLSDEELEERFDRADSAVGRDRQILMALLDIRGLMYVLIEQTKPATVDETQTEE